MLDAVARLMPDVVYLIDSAGCISYLSPGWETITGFTVEETLGKPAIDLVDARDRDAYRSVFEQLLTNHTNTHLRYEARCVTRHGRETWLAANLHVTTVPGSGMVSVGTLRDETARHVGSGSVPKMLADLRFILDSLPGMSFITDHDGQVVHASRACEEFLGSSFAMFAGNQWLSLLHPDDAGRVTAEAHAWRIGRLPFSTTVRLRVAEGSWRWVRLTGVPRFSDDGFYHGHLGFLNDETEARETAAALAARDRLFATLLDTLVTAVFVADADGTILVANAPGQQLLDLSGGRGALRAVREGVVVVLREDGSVMPEDEWPFLVVRRTGEPQLQRTLGLRWPVGEVEWYRVSYSMIPSQQSVWPAGSVMSSWENVTAQRIAQRATGALEVAAAEQRAAERDLKATAAVARAVAALARVSRWDGHEGIAELLVPDFADFCRIVVLETEHPDASFIDMSSAPATHIGPVAPWRGALPALGAHPVLRRALLGGERLHLLPGDPEWSEFATAGAEAIPADASLLVVPVRPRGVVSGALLLVRSHGPAAGFSAHDQSLAEGFATTVGNFGERVLIMRALTQELSEREAAELSLRMSEERFRMAAGAVSDLVFDVDIATRTVHFAKTESDLLPLDSPVLHGAPLRYWMRRVHAEDRARLLADVRSLIEGAVLFSAAEYRFYDTVGRLRWLRQRISALRDAHQRVVRLIGVASDVTEMVSQRELRDADQARLSEIVSEQTRELRVKNAELARSATLKDEFLASMSHELRTPLNAVLGLSEAMTEDVFGPVTTRQIVALRDISESGRHLLELINDILDLSKVAAGKMEPEFDWTDLREIAEIAIRMVTQIAHAKHQRLAVHIADGTSVRWTDPRWIKQVLVNLLTNAVKFTPDGGVITLEVSYGPREVMLTVADSGIGIQAADQARIFEPFVQVRQGLNRPQGGTGLGLALVRALIERLEGTVALESTIGVGSTFRVMVPMAPESQETPATELAGAGAAPADVPQSVGNRRVLLAEDNEANIRTFVAYLEAKGYEVDVARNGQLAVAMARAHRPDVILMDVQMPVMDGIQATQLLRADAAFSTLPIIALTAFAMPGDRERCIAAGANEHLAKPVSLRALVALIEQLCTASSAGRKS
jgi:PAS domain S-box-containing protein